MTAVSPPARRPPSFGWLLVAPHRLFFFIGACSLGIVSLWWTYVLLARVWPLPIGYAVAPTYAHALAMLFGFLPFFMFGFLFTAGPRWLGMDQPEPRSLLRPGLAACGGFAAFLASQQWSALAAALGLAVYAAAWLALWLRFVGLVRASPVRERVHPILVAVALGLGLLALACAALGLALDVPRLVQTGIVIAIWGFAAPVYVIVTHRMIPFFTASVLPVLDAWRPFWLLWSMLGLLGWHGLAEALEAAGAIDQRAADFLTLPGDVAGAALLLWLSWRWGVVQSLRIRLLAMLHLGFLWLGLAFALFAVSALARLATEGSLSLGLAPTHALTMGFIGSLLLAMVTRVTCGHGGQALAADNFVWTVFWVFQVAVLLRMATALASLHAPALAVATAFVWCGALGAWIGRYAPWYLRARADGRPG